MKKQLLLPLAAVAGGAAALVLRLLQNKTGFEAATGLPVSGNAPGMALVVFLAALAVVLFVLAGLLPAEDEGGPFFPEDFRTVNAGLVSLVIMGVFLMAISGGMDLLAGAAFMNPGGIEVVGGQDGPAVYWMAGNTAAAGLALTPKARMLMGVLTLAAAISLFPAAAC